MRIDSCPIFSTTQRTHCTLRSARKTVLKVENAEMTYWDVGNNRSFLAWKAAMQSMQGLVFVVDSNDRDRIPAACIELRRMLDYEELNGYPLLVLANKQHLPGAMSVPEMDSALNLDSLNASEYSVYASSQGEPDSDRIGIEWLVRKSVESENEN